MRIGLREKVLHLVAGKIKISARIWDDEPTIIVIGTRDGYSGILIHPSDLPDLIEALQDVNRTYGPQHGEPGEGQGKLV